MILFKNAKIYPINSEPFTGSLSVKDDKIEAVSSSDIKEEFDEIVDCGGNALLPGFIDAHTHEGLFQGEIGDAGDDVNEMSDPITPHLRAVDAINPFDPSLRESYEGGVTLLNTGPGSANVFGGLFSVIRPIGSVVDEMLIKSPSALKIAFGENPKDVYSKHEKEPQTRMAIAALIREWFYKAQEYMEKKKHEDSEDEDKKPEFDLKLEALSLALKGEICVHAHAHRSDDIATAIRISEEFGLKLVLIHATEGHKIADYIAKKNIPCVVGPSFPGREKAELNEISFKTAAVLSECGVKVALQSDTYPPVKYFHSILCMAHKYGMKREEVLKSVTINAAEILGIDNSFGSLASGKTADILLFDSPDPLNFYSKIKKVYVSGKAEVI